MSLAIRFQYIPQATAAPPPEIADNRALNNSGLIADDIARRRARLSFRPAIYGSQLRAHEPSTIQTQPAIMARAVDAKGRVRKGLAFRTAGARREPVVIAEEITRRALIAHDPDPRRRLRKFLDIQISGGRRPENEGTAPAPVMRGSDHQRRMRDGFLARLAGGRLPENPETFPATVTRDPDAKRRYKRALAFRTRGATDREADGSWPALVAKDPDARRRYRRPLAITVNGARKEADRVTRRMDAVDVDPKRRRGHGWIARQKGATGPEADGSAPATIARTYDEARRYRQALIVQLDGGRKDDRRVLEEGTWPATIAREVPGQRRRGHGFALRTNGGTRQDPVVRPSRLLAADIDAKRRRGHGYTVRTLGARPADPVRTMRPLVAIGQRRTRPGWAQLRITEVRPEERTWRPLVVVGAHRTRGGIAALPQPARDPERRTWPSHVVTGYGRAEVSRHARNASTGTRPVLEFIPPPPVRIDGILTWAPKWLRGR